MDSKYYNPDISDIIEGYEYESQEYNEDEDVYTDKWERHKFDSRGGLGHDLTCQFTEGTVRVKYLDEKDVESLGWIIKEPDDLYVVIEKPFSEYQKYEALLDKKDHTMSIAYVNNDPGLEHPIDEYLFDGKCPTINELRYISKLLGI